MIHSVNWQGTIYLVEKKNSCSRCNVHFEISGVASFHDASADI